MQLALENEKARRAKVFTRPRHRSVDTGDRQQLAVLENAGEQNRRLTRASPREAGTGIAPNEMARGKAASALSGGGN